MPRVSVIVPVYNAKRLLGRCVDAILGQTMESFELLLVDDGSTDGSLGLCRRLAKTDPRVRVIGRLHEGVSAARNAGLAEAMSPWVAFADADDAPRPDWLGRLVALAADDALVTCGYQVWDENGSPMHGTERPGMVELEDVAPRAYIEDLFSNARMYQGYVWNKLFARSVIEGLGRDHVPLRFDTRLPLNEDRVFVLGYMLRCSTVRHSDVAVYDYRARTAPRPFREADLAEFLAFDEMQEQLEGPGFERALDFCLRDRFRAAVQMLSRAREAGAGAAAAQLASEAQDLRRYADTFPEYGPEMQELIVAALA